MCVCFLFTSFSNFFSLFCSIGACFSARCIEWHVLGRPSASSSCPPRLTSWQMWTTSSTHYSPLSAAGTPTTSYSKKDKKKHAQQKCVDVYLGGMLAILIIRVSFRLWTLWTGSVADGTVVNERAIYAKQKKRK